MRVRKIAKNHYYLRHVGLHPSFHMEKKSAPTGRIFIKFGMYVFFENLSRKSTSDKNKGYFK